MARTLNAPTTMPTRSLADALRDPDAGPLLTRLALHQRIGACVAEALGPLARDTGCADPGSIEQRGSVIVLRVSTTAAAAKLRQTVPRIMTHLQQRGIQVTEIRVKVQPAPTPEPIAGTGPGHVRQSTDESGRGPPFPAAGARALADTLSRTLPDSPLQRAVERLRKRLNRPT